MTEDQGEVRAGRPTEAELYRMAKAAAIDLMNSRQQMGWEMEDATRYIGWVGAWVAFVCARDGKEDAVVDALSMDIRRKVQEMKAGAGPMPKQPTHPGGNA